MILKIFIIKILSIMICCVYNINISLFEFIMICCVYNINISLFQNFDNFVNLNNSYNLKKEFNSIINNKNINNKNINGKIFYNKVKLIQSSYFYKIQWINFFYIIFQIIFYSLFENRRYSINEFLKKFLFIEIHDDDHYHFFSIKFKTRVIFFILLIIFPLILIQLKYNHYKNLNQQYNLNIKIFLISIIIEIFFIFGAFLHCFFTDFMQCDSGYNEVNFRNFFNSGFSHYILYDRIFILLSMLIINLLIKFSFEIDNLQLKILLNKNNNNNFINQD